MLSRWSIRYKLLVGCCVLLAIVITLSFVGIYGLYDYRDLVRTLSRRGSELPLANQLSHDVANLRVALADHRTWCPPVTDGALSIESTNRFSRQEFELYFRKVEETLARYRQRLIDNANVNEIGDNHLELKNIADIEATLQRIRASYHDQHWVLNDVRISQLQHDLELLQELAARFPNFLHSNLADFSEAARIEYRFLLTLSWVTTIATLLLLLVYGKLFYDWIFHPLQTLLKGSRKVAQGNFSHRIRLTTHDEMAELAGAMNEMTERFQATRDDLDRQVQERTKQVIRNEQLASVGFLAAGVAHEINNPLAAIAMSADGLEERLGEALPLDHPDRSLVKKYLRMIQDEAFRCKGITEALLDFSRIGDVKRHATNLGELVLGVTEMIRHLGKYQTKQVRFRGGEMIQAQINPQQIKQVVLNLIVNALDAVGEEGLVDVSVAQRRGMAEVTVVDNGSGMTDEVREHLFEPFFTGKAPGVGTGLGLSIAHRIVTDHGGSIEPHSDGPGRGSRFVVSLPLANASSEVTHRYRQAA